MDIPERHHNVDLLPTRGTRVEEILAGAFYDAIFKDILLLLLLVVVRICDMGCIASS